MKKSKWLYVSYKQRTKCAQWERVMGYLIKDTAIEQANRLHKSNPGFGFIVNKEQVVYHIPASGRITKKAPQKGMMDNSMYVVDALSEIVASVTGLKELIFILILVILFSLYAVGSKLDCIIDLLRKKKGE